MVYRFDPSSCGLWRVSHRDSDPARGSPLGSRREDPAADRRVAPAFIFHVLRPQHTDRLAQRVVAPGGLFGNPLGGHRGQVGRLHLGGKAFGFEPPRLDGDRCADECPRPYGVDHHQQGARAGDYHA